MHRISRRFALLVLPLALAAARPAAAAMGPVEVAVDGEIRLRMEPRDNFDLNEDLDDATNPMLSRLRLRLAAKTGDWARFVVQFQDSRAWGEEASTASDESNVDLHQGYMEFLDLLGRGSALQLGRQEWIYGDERMIGAFGWDNVGRSFDGVRAQVPLGSSRLDLMWARLKRDQVETAETNQDLLGAYFTHATDQSTIDLYALGYRDGGERAGERSGESGDTFIGAFGVRGKVRASRIELTAEGAVETGSQAGDDLSAGAFGGRLGINLIEGDNFFRPLVGYDYATGDEEPGDGERGEFFNFFPTNHLHYGSMDLFGWRNINSPWGGAEFGQPKWKGQVKYHSFDLAQARGPWKSATGIVLGFDPLGESGKSVGSEWDATFWWTIKPELKLNAGYGHFSPGRFAEQTRGQDSQDWGYLQIAYTFDFAPGKKAAQ